MAKGKAKASEAKTVKSKAKKPTKPEEIQPIVAAYTRAHEAELTEGDVPLLPDDPDGLCEALDSQIIPARKWRAKPGRKALLKPDALTLGLVRNLGHEDHSQAECATILGVSLRTFERFLADCPEAREAYEDGLNMARASLRRLQWRSARKGSDRMLEFLGKNLLGQKDHKHVTADFAHNHTHAVSETRRWLEQEAGSGDADGPAKLVPI